MSSLCFTRRLRVTLLTLAAVALVVGQPARAEKPSAFAYIVYDGGTIEQYRVTPGGAFTPLEPPSAKIENAPTRLVVEPGSKYAYIADDSRKLRVFAINTNGSLSPVDDMQLPAGKTPLDILIDASGTHLYVCLAGKVSERDSEIVAFSIESNGKLTRIDAGSFSTGETTYALAENPAVPCLYAADRSEDSITAYLMNRDGGLLPFNPPPLPGGGMVGDMAVTPDNRFMYVTESRRQGITQFRVGDDGRTSFVSRASFTSLLGGQGNPAEVAFTGVSDVILVVYPSGSALCQFKLDDGRLPSTPRFYFITRNNRLLTLAELEALAEATPSVQSAVADKKAEQEIDEARGRARQSLCATPGSIASGPDGVLYLFSSAGVLRLKVDKDGTLKDLGSAIRWKDKWDVVSDNTSMGKRASEGVELPARHGITVVTR
jgi:hypothetical protein